MLKRQPTFNYALQIADGLIHAKTIADTSQKDTISFKIENVFSNSQNGIDHTLITVIKLIQRLQDIENNIFTDTFIQSDVPVCFRDARKMHVNVNKNPYHPFAIMGLQALLAARKLLQLANISDVDERFRIRDAQDFYQRISQNIKEDYPEYDLALFIEQCILPELTDALEISQEEALRRLHVAKDFVNFEYPTTAVATLTSHIDDENKVVNVLHVDVPITNLNPALQEEYRQRSEKKWYRAFLPWQQQFIEEYMEPLLEGRVIPTQLRKYLPGLRNAAEERVFALNDSSSEAVEIYHSFHSGNLGHLTKEEEDNIAFTGFALDQLISEVQPARLHLTSLISPITKRAKWDIESKLDDQVNRAADVRRNQVTWGVVPLNPLRHFTIEHSRTGWMIQSVEKLLKTVIAPASLIASLSGRDFWDKNLISLLPEEYKSNFYFVELIRVAHSLKKTKISSDRKTDGNRHLKLARDIALLAFYHEQCCYILNRPDVTPFVVNIFCKSGKDRTGLLSLTTIIYAVAKYLVRHENNTKLYRQKLDEVTQLIVGAQHVQRRAGEVGATMGAQGFVPSLMYALPERFKDKSLEPLILFKAARFNTKYPRSEKVKLSNAQKNRLYVECESALQSLLTTGFSSDDLRHRTVNLLIYKARKALEAGVSYEDTPILRDLLISGKKLVDHSNPASTEYNAELRRYTRHTKQVIGNPRLGKILGGVALCLLGAAIIAASIALIGPTGGISLFGILIAAKILTIGVSFIGGACFIGGLFFAASGRKQGVALASQNLGLSFAPGEIRTPDPLVRSH